MLRKDLITATQQKSKTLLGSTLRIISINHWLQLQKLVMPKVIRNFSHQVLKLLPGMLKSKKKIVTLRLNKKERDD